MRSTHPLDLMSRLCALTPFERPSAPLLTSLAHAHLPLTLCLDLSCGPSAYPWGAERSRGERVEELLARTLNSLPAHTRLSLRLSRSSGWSPERLERLLSAAQDAEAVERLLLPAEELLSEGADTGETGKTGEAGALTWGAWAQARGLTLWLELYQRDELEAAMSLALKREGLIEGLVITGSEAAGRCGDQGAFLALQRALKTRATLKSPLKLILRGGLSAETGAAALTMGCDVLMLDEQLARCELSEEGALAPRALLSLLPSLEPSNSLLVDEDKGRARRLSRPHLPHALQALTPPLPLSADHPWVTSFALVEDGTHANNTRTLRPPELVTSFAGRVASLLDQATTLQERASPLALIQGPMTRVSDTPEFALEVAKAGGLPFLALSLLSEARAERLLRDTQALLGELPWGVGVLGFAPPELRATHFELIKRFKPSAALIAGGRPSQARPLEEAGVPTYLHAPSPALLSGFVKAGARRFIFEGSECGGHIGPSTSFSLWSAQLSALERLLQEGALPDPERLELWWAGGLHDAPSVAGVRALSARLAAQGAQVGALMGTAYLFTQEAVSAGAILEEYQRVAIACERTEELHTAPGHATRCAPTGFVEEFKQTRERLEREGVEARERWASLEQLNVGRLRLASKGLERQGEALRERGLEEQRARGMYMIGEVATLRSARLTIRELHQEAREGSLEHLSRALPLSALERTQALTRDPTRDPTSALRSPQEEPSMRAQPMRADTQDTREQRGRSGDAIALVGLSCLFPKASDHEAYWSLILDGLDAVTEVPDERWPKDIYYDPSAPAGEKVASKWGAFLEPLAFEPARYGLPPTTLSAIEPVQLLALEVASRALRDAGYAALKGEAGRELDRERVAVIFGAEAGTDLANAYSLRGTLPQWVGPLTPALEAQLPKLTEDSFAGVLANVIAGRVANRLDLGGANFTVDAACASSLTALDAAVKELKLGEADLVLCGGADLHNSVNDYLMFSSVHALSKTGRCRTFDKSADGIALGEGVAVIALKRLSDAQRDGDRVYAVIEGVGASSDGRHFGLTAPRKEGQQRALERAYKRAGVSAAELGLIEAHGTGTVVGDKTELSALSDTFIEAGSPPRAVVLGSVKSQIGHTKCAAGMAGLIKAALSIYRRTLTPTLHVKEPNAAYEPSSSPFVFLPSPQPWLSAARWAGVSAFGFGGTNFHAVLREAPQQPAPKHLRGAWRQEPLVLLAESAEQLRGRAQRWADVIKARLALIAQGEAPHEAQLRDLAYALWRDGSEALTRGAHRAQAGAVALCSTWEEALNTLLSLAEDPSLKRREGDEREAPLGLLTSWGRSTVLGGGSEVSPQPWRAPSEVAALFPGQGAQRVGVMSELATTFGVVSERWSQHLEWAQLLCPLPPKDAEARKAQSATLTDTRNAQPALGLSDLAMWELLTSVGVTPKHVAGHSYGELVALSVAGVIPRAQLAPISATRGEVILSAAEGGDPGAMAAMKASAPELREALSELQARDPRLEGVVIANLNAPTQSVLSGPTEAVELALNALKERKLRGRKIPVACAFHSGVVASAGPRFEARLNELGLYELSPERGVVVWSNERAEPYPVPLSGAEVAARLSSHIASPVRFVEQVEAMYEAGVRVFVEVGPGRILTKLVGEILGERPHEVVSCAPERGDVAELLGALASLSALGLPIEWGELFSGRAHVLSAEQLGAPHPARLLWWVNGHRAWPMKGELTQGLRPPKAPLGWRDPNAAPSVSAPVSPQGPTPPSTQLTSTPTPSLEALTPSFSQPSPHSGSDLMTSPVPPQPASAAHSSALNAYLENMRALADAQRQVMLAALGQPTSPLVSAQPQAVLSASPSPLTSAVSAPVLDTVSESEAWWSSLTTAEPASVSPSVSLEVSAEASAQPLSQASPQATSQATHEAPTLSSTPEQSASAPTDVGALLTGLVSERTGYPTEMLDPSLDLEADLGVDSIKRIEILGALGEQLGLASDGEGEAMVEELAMMKTLGEMSAWLNARLGGAQEAHTTSPTSDNSSDNSSEEGSRPKAEGERLPRRARVWVDAPLEQTSVSSAEPSAEPSTQLYTLLSEQLERALTAQLSEISSTREVEGAQTAPPLFDVTSLEREQGVVELLWVREQVSLSLGHEMKHKTGALALELLRWARSRWGDSVQEHAPPPVAVLVVAPQPKDRAEALELGALNGFCKTLKREVPELKLRLMWRDASTQELNADLQSALKEGLTQELSELLSSTSSAPQEGVEGLVVRLTAREGSLLRQEERYELTPELSPELNPKLTSEAPQAHLGALLVTGGARGITAHCLRALPLEGRVLLLCGRSPQPSERSALWEANAEVLSALEWGVEERELKRALLKSAPALSRQEASALLREGQARVEIEAQLSALKALGASPFYLSVDVSDERALREALSGALEQARSTLSSLGLEAEELTQRLEVSEVLHAAGVIEDKKLKDKTDESFERVWRVKVAGASALLSVAPNAQRWLLFSSVSSALGNKGQLDYASANAALDELAERLSREGREALSIQWGPWGGAGMVSDTLARFYERSGVKLIELDEGVRAFVRERGALSQASALSQTSSAPLQASVVLRSWPFER